MGSTSYKVLIVDDSEDHRFLLKRALNKVASFCVVAGAASDGEMAIEYLAGTGSFSDRAMFPFPDVMLLDLKMPRMSGFDVLRWVRKEKLDQLWVIVLSSSHLESDVAEAKALGSHHYVVKEEIGVTACLIAKILEMGRV